MNAPAGFTVLPIPVSGEVPEGRRLGDLVLDSAAKARIKIRHDDVIVVTQKVVSKAEGRVVEVALDDPEARRGLAISEASRIVRRRDGLIITETKHGFVCANSGIDTSNVPSGFAGLLPVDPDVSARRIRSRIKALAGIDVFVIISDTFGRAWRIGQTNVAIGVAGMKPTRNYTGTKDSFGLSLHSTNIAIADELAGAAELVMGKSDGVPIALIRGVAVVRGRGSARELARPAQDDLFR
ncbi:MAG: coenzyme F420-0:L-glutamate ligase [Actinomycetota bacterium]